jgi:phage terminase small subunit
MSAAAKPKKPNPLSAKMQAFVSEFLVDKNGAAAAQRAGYSAKSAKQEAYKLLQDERIGAAIDKALEAHAMRASEGIALLADWGRGSVARFLKVDEQGNMSINLHHDEAQQHLHLIKKLKQTRTSYIVEEMERVEVKTEIELYDAKDAVHKILQIHGRYAPQKHDHTTNGKDLPAGQGPNIYMPDNGR